MPDTATPGEVYAERRDRFKEEGDAHARRAARLANLRLAAFLAAVAALVWAEVGAPNSLPEALYLAVLAFVGFLVLVGLHARTENRRRRAHELQVINEDGLARLRRDWNALPQHGPPAGPPGHAYARDLDLFGHASLARLLSTGTPGGRQRLAGWLLEAAPVEEIHARQGAVRELTPRIELRQRLEVAGRLAGNLQAADLDRFLDWVETPGWLAARPLVRWAAWVVPLASVVLIALQVHGTLAGNFWLLPILAGGTLTMVVRRSVHGAFERASFGEGRLQGYAELLTTLCEADFSSPRLADSHQCVAPEGGDSAPRSLRRLAWLVELADLRNNGMFWLPIHALTLWDFHVLRALEHWKAGAGTRVRDWLTAVADVDALSALAGLAFEEPGWCMPELVPVDATDEPLLEAHDLAHPLLPDDVRVANDVSVGPPGSFLMVTGSNMSGKTTLLRAIGVNVVLAHAGGPVCARALRMPPVRLHTSMRIEDSLEEGVSLFMAELRRLKTIADAATECAQQGMCVLLYLLDEILHGTNSAERQVAVRRVVTHLLEAGAIGAISTHDLELADAQPLLTARQAVHLQETVGEGADAPTMSFDYKLRPGVATSTNALKLVRLVGLD